MAAELTNPISGQNIMDRFQAWIIYLAQVTNFNLRYGRGSLPQVSGHIAGNPAGVQNFVPNAFFSGPTAGVAVSVGGPGYKRGDRINANQLATILCQEFSNFALLRRARFRYVVLGTGGNLGNKNPQAAAARAETLFVDETAMSYISRSFTIQAGDGEGVQGLFLPRTGVHHGQSPIFPAGPTVVNMVPTAGAFIEVMSAGYNNLQVNYSSSFSGLSGPHPQRPTNMITGKLINRTDIEVFFNRITNALLEVSNHTNPPIYQRTVCHASCHGSCHGSRGRR